MKKLFVCVLLVAFGISLAAGQISFLGLWFGQTVSEVNKQLEKQGFAATEDPLAYETHNTSDINRVELTLDKTDKINGWIIYFNPDLSADHYYAILDEAIKMHGKKYESRISENALAWNLEDGRDFRLGFDDNLALKFGVYHDNNSN